MQYRAQSLKISEKCMLRTMKPVLQMENIFKPFFLTIEGTIEKVLKLLMLLSQFKTKNFGFNKQKCILNTSEGLRQENSF
jgi:hypothetical protein